MPSLPVEAVLPRVAVRPRFSDVRECLPGVALSVGLAAAAFALRGASGLSILSPAIIAILLGIAARQILGRPRRLQPGLAFSVRTLLRLAVVLLGLQVTLGQVASLGLGALGAVAGALLSCFAGTVWLGRLLGVEWRLARLIATGTAVCGASAVAAANSVTRGEDEDVAYALAAVTVLGTVAMVVTPGAAMFLHLDPSVAGLWTGASIHEVAQVVGAATQLGDTTTQVATVAKMARVLMLAPLVVGVAIFGRRPERIAGQPQARVPVPWFVFGFLALAALASLQVVPATMVKQVGGISSFMLAAALAAMGYGIDIAHIRRKGLRPLLLALSSWLLLAGVSLGLVMVLS